MFMRKNTSVHLHGRNDLFFNKRVQTTPALARSQSYLIQGQVRGTRGRKQLVLRSPNHATVDSIEAGFTKKKDGPAHQLLYACNPARRNCA